MLRNALGVAVGFVLSLSAATCNEGCTPYPHTVYTSQSQMDEDYKAEIKACVKTANTKEQSDYCQMEVRYRYGVCEVPNAARTWPPTYAPCPRP